MTIWVVSDTHFGHENIIGYCGRPFATAAEMDEAMVDRWNRVVRPSDKVYHLGDVAMRREHLAIVKRLHGKKRLIRGNHDIFDTKDYLDAGFQEILGVRVLAGALLSHFPVHPESLGRFKGNIHGHIHEKPSPAGPYLNVSVERVDYAPITLERAIAMLPPAPTGDGTAGAASSPLLGETPCQCPCGCDGFTIAPGRCMVCRVREDCRRLSAGDGTDTPGGTR